MKGLTKCGKSGKVYNIHSSNVVYKRQHPREQVCACGEHMYQMSRENIGIYIALVYQCRCGKERYIYLEV